MKQFINQKLIEDYIKANNLTITKFCKLCKISPNTLRKLFNNEDCRLNAVLKIARTMDVDLYKLFNG